MAHNKASPGKTIKTKRYVEIRDRVFDKRNRGELDIEVLDLTGEVLKKNPDVYTFWNVRRETIPVIRERAEEESEKAHAERTGEIFDNELALTQEALKSNPKSYSAWHHRFWALKHHPAANLKRELDLCEMALTLDCRNFHCWDHRRSVAKLFNLGVEDELQFSDRLIAQNSSNYSAWHYRATLLPKVKPGEEGIQISDDCFEEEMKKIGAICCVNSEDQTAWTYCRWLLDVAAAPGAITHEKIRGAVHEFVDMCRELQEEEDDNPYIYLALTRGEVLLDGVTEGNATKIRARFDKIKELDPQRKGMYTDLLANLLRVLPVEEE